MRVRHSTTAATLVTLDASAPLPLHRQLFEGLRQAILAGALRPGVRLPASRALAADLHVSRNTVVAAFDQLGAEGYLERRARGGTYVTRAIPDRLLGVSRRAPARESRTPIPFRPPARVLSARGEGLSRIVLPASVNTEMAPRPFRPGVPALDAFPMATWAALCARHWRRARPQSLAYGHSAGYRPLREAIAEHVATARGVRCTPDDIIIVGGAQQALDITTRLLLDPGDLAWIEDPGYMGARAALAAAGARIVPVRVDDEGLDVAEGERLAPDARLAFVSPSHQHPLGMAMTLPRRRALLRWAQRADAWILEDDYDSEIRYRRRPLPSLQGLDADGRVIYVGTFSKTLFPALRLGYVVAPRSLADAFAKARLLADRHSSVAEQAVLADFIAGGHYTRHIRRMRELYAERQATLLEAAAEELYALADVQPTDAGMNVIAWLPRGVSDVDAYRSALDEGVEAPPLSPFAQTVSLERGGLILNFAGYDTASIRDGVQRLRTALRRLAAREGQRAG